MVETDGRRLRGDRSRAKILAHATVIASSEGLEGLSFGKVATKAGIGKGNIQILFGDKEALQLATLENAVEIYHAAVIIPAMAKRTPLARLRKLVEGWFEFVENRKLPGGCFINAVSVEYCTRPGPIRDRVNVYRAATRDRFRRCIVEAKRTGDMCADLDVRRLVFDLVAYQAIANVAALMDDREEFHRARAMSFESIRAGSGRGTVKSRRRVPTMESQGPGVK